MGVVSPTTETLVVVSLAPCPIFEHIVDPSIVFVHKVFSDSALGDDTSTYFFLFNYYHEVFPFCLFLIIYDFNGTTITYLWYTLQRTIQTTISMMLR